MKKMADQLDKKQKDANKKQEEEDIDSLRAILESLMILSDNYSPTGCEGKAHERDVLTSKPQILKVGIS